MADEERNGESTSPQQLALGSDRGQEQEQNDKDRLLLLKALIQENFVFGPDFLEE